MHRGIVRVNQIYWQLGVYGWDKRMKIMSYFRAFGIPQTESSLSRSA